MPICGIHKYPKRFPAVSRFLTRFNLARLLHQEMWFGDWRDVSMKEWTMIQLAMRTTLKMEHEQMKDAIPKGRKHG